VVSRLSPYKRFDIVVDAFNELDLPLKIIGSGVAAGELCRRARGNIEFLGNLPDFKVREYLAQCRALIFPGEEDFGMVALEAQACGRPVVAYRAGGAGETVVEGKSGMFFDAQTSPALVQAIKKFNFALFDKNTIRQHALQFNKENFKSKIDAFVRRKYEEKFGQIA
jgi:glycosyltransferase involved in cell wall biosynthesis